MKLLIEIPEKEYEQKKELSKIPNLYESDCFNIDRAIANGTPLPKGHGRLIDANEAKERLTDAKDGYARHVIDSTPTIIEADLDEEEA